MWVRIVHGKEFNLTSQYVLYVPLDGYMGIYSYHVKIFRITNRDIPG